jgi:hypothetical protein
MHKLLIKMAYQFVNNKFEPGDPEKQSFCQSFL